MGSTRSTKSQKAVEQCPLTRNIFVERLKRIRALNGSPSLFGINSVVIRKIAKNIYLVTR